MNTRPLNLLGLLALLALQVATPGHASRHALTAHHHEASASENSSLSAHEERGECRLCEFSRHLPERLAGPDQVAVSPAFETPRRAPPAITPLQQALLHSPYASRAPPLS